MDEAVPVSRSPPALRDVQAKTHRSALSSVLLRRAKLLMKVLWVLGCVHVPGENLGLFARCPYSPQATLQKFSLLFFKNFGGSL